MARTKEAKKFLLNHKCEIALVVVAALLLFSNLGDRTFGGDETFGMELVTNILAHGAPLLRNNLGLTYNLTMTINSPVSEYLMAGSAIFLGFSEFSARFIIAVFGLLSIVAIYLFARRVSGSKRTGLLALLITVFSAVFYLHARYARYYGVALFFNIVFLYAFYEYFVKKSGGKWTYVLIASFVLLFYTHAETAVYTSIAAFVWILLKRKQIKLKDLVRVLAPALVLIAPLFYILATSKTYQLTATGLPPILQPNFLNVFILYLSTGVYYYLLFFVPLIFLFFLPAALKKYDKSVLLLFLLVVLSHLVVASAIGPFGTPAVRKLFVGTFPIDVLVLAAVINYLLEKKNILRTIAPILLILLLFTNFVFLFPVALFKPQVMQVSTSLIPDSTKNSFINDTLQPRYYFVDLLYEVTHHYESPVEKILDTLKTGSPGDKILYPNGFSITPYTNRFGMVVSYNASDLKTATFDWIILGPEDQSIASGFDQTLYQSATYSVPNYDDPWIDTADPVHHRFDSNNVPTVTLTIYHLIKK